MCSRGDSIAQSAMPSPCCEALEFRSGGRLRDVCEEDYAGAASGCASMAEQSRSTTCSTDTRPRPS